MNSQIIKLAAEAMRVSEDVAAEHYKDVPEINGWCFWRPVRGGIRVLINSEGERLAASSGLSFQKHVDAFLAGKRN